MNRVSPLALAVHFLAPVALLEACAAPRTESADHIADAAADRCDVDIEHRLLPNPSELGETYVCFGFDAQSFAGQTVKGLLWQAPSGGGVLWHHATLSAVPGDFPDGPVPCDGMPPGSVSLHVWTPGGDNLVLPETTGLALPETTTRLAVEMHVLRTDTAPANAGSLGICLNHQSVANRARFFGVAAPIPALRPRSVETASTTCTFQSRAHLWSIWPHMHRLGTAIEAVLIRGAERTTLRRVDPWEFTRQKTYSLDVDIDVGDRVESTCWWNNVTDEYVFAGLRTTDEMCNQGFIGWPEPRFTCE